MVNQNKILETEIKITYQEYKKIQTYFPYSFWKSYIITILVILFISLLALLPPEPSTITELLLANLVFMVTILFLFGGLNLLFRKVSYKKKLKRNIDNFKYTLSFYSDYFEKKSKKMIQTIKYSDIWKVREIDNRIYILLDKKNIIPILKEECNDEFIEFLRKDKRLHSKGSSKIENIDEYMEPTKKYSKMRIFLIVLFILTILSIWLGLLIVSFLTHSNYPSFLIEYFPSMRVSISSFYVEVSSALMISYLWGVFLCLPIPILSIVLGIIYRRKGLKCLKNIVVGIIVGVILFAIGITSFVSNPNLEHDYQEVYSYQEMIGVEMPTEGRFFELESAYYDVLSIHYIWFSNTLETEKFYNNLKTGEYWLSSQEVSTNLAYFIPIVCQSTEQECYYSIYVRELNTYNQLPSELGEYHIECMVYDPDILSFKMVEYVYQKFV